MHLTRLQPPCPSFLNYNKNLCIVKTKFKNMVHGFYLAPLMRVRPSQDISHVKQHPLCWPQVVNLKSFS